MTVGPTSSLSLRSAPSFAPLPTVYSHTLPPCAFVLVALPVADRSENMGPTHTRPDPLNLTWQVPAEWTRLGPSQRAPSPCPFLSPYIVPILRRLSACLTFSVLPVYGQLLSVLFASLSLSLYPSLMMAAIALACIMAHKKRSTSALNHLQRVTPR